jgi:type I restriction enzyme S subunit
VSDIAALVADNLDIWTGAIERKSGAGRGGGKRISLYGIDRLRALILDLAVRGKLSAKDPATKQGSLGQVGNWAGGNGFPKSFQGKADDDFPFLKVSDMNLPGNERQITVANNYVSAEDLQAMGAKAHPSGTIIFPKIGGAIATNKRRILGTPSAIDNNCAGQIPGKNTDVDWLYMVLSSIDMSKYQAGTSVPALNMKKLAQHPIAIPTLSEQRRIVTKVEDLLALCDALERESAGAMAAHQALVEILLATLVNSADAADLARDGARLECHFDTLFTTDASIDALKQTILDLAVRGKLVEQNTNDGSATKAIAQTKLLKQELIQKNEIRKDKTSLPLTEKEMPFVVPSSWEWSRIGTVALSTEYGTSRKATSGDSGIILLAMGNIKNGVVDLESQKSIPKDSDEIPHLILKPGDILYNRTNSYELVGKTGIFRHENEGYSFASYLIRIRLDERTIEPEFLNMAMNTPYFRQTQVVPKITKQTGQANVSGGAMRNMLIPIPPLAEQRRIVAKVEALMALCDALKARLADAAQTQRHLADAITQRAAA